MNRSDELDRHPATALLVIEIAVTSRVTDTTVKTALYANAGVPEYWVIDVPGRRVEIRREPVGPEYRRIEIFAPGHQVAPPALELPLLDVAALFPIPGGAAPGA